MSTFPATTRRPSRAVAALDGKIVVPEHGAWAGTLWLEVVEAAARHGLAALAAARPTSASSATRSAAA